MSRTRRGPRYDPSMPLEPGSTFADFKVLQLLGSGGMGEVYLVEHPRLPRTDALKVLPAAISADPAYRQRFTREADLAARLWHPNIIGLHDRGEFNDQLWISMDYVRGLDVAELLQHRRPGGLQPDEVAAIALAVASALDYAHASGLLHRDVKPANILLSYDHGDGERRIVLSDFGIARPIEEIGGLTTTNMTVGTVSYAAPEQLMGQSIDGRSDQYALAATVFHLLTGSPPFADSNPAVVISKHLNAPPPRLADHRPELGAADSVMARALAKNPADRFGRCTDFAQALAAALAPSGRTAPVTAADATAASVTSPSWHHVETQHAGAAGAPFGYPTAPAVPQPAPRSAAALVVPLVLVALLVGAVAFAIPQFLRGDPRPSTAPPQWQPYVDFATTFTEHLMTTSPPTADANIERIISESTGQFRQEFSDQRDSFRKSLLDAGVTTTSKANVGALASVDDASHTALVLVAATSTVSNSNGANNDPQSWRLQVTVEKSDDAYKTSKVEFTE